MKRVAAIVVAASALSYIEAHQQWVERHRRAILAVFEQAIAANKVAIDQRTAEAVDTGLPDHDIRIRAANTVLDRAFGKPGTKMELTGGVTLAALMADSPQAITNTRLDDD